MDTPEQSPAILSLCTGGRMLDEGVESALRHVRAVAYVEIEAFCIWNLVAQMEAGLLAPAPVWTNLKTFPAQQFHNKVHGIIGGYPCQPFSHAGQRRGADDERHLFPHICRIIEAVEPLWCFFENVPGHLSMGYDEVYRSLRALGYTVEAGIYSAAEVGATHNRERLFILAMAHPESGRSMREPGAVCETDGRPVNGLLRQPDSAGEVGNAESGRTGGRRNETKTGEGFGIDRASGEMGNSISNGSKARLSESEQWQKRLTKILNDHRNRKFPAPPGAEQYAWEAPRVESSMGFSAHGYNFREDLLRMAGNGVVWQTAAKAFTELWQKIDKR